MDDQEGRFTFLPHTADAKFIAYGKTREELFANAGIACFEIITETDKVKQEKSFPIKVTAKKIESLLFDYLDELLFLLDTEGLLVCAVDELIIAETDGEFSLSATVKGDYHKNYDVSCNVKAVTYSDMEIKEENGAWQATVVVDL